MRRLCAGVRLIEFSPCESYVVSYSALEPNNPREQATVVLNIFSCRNGKKLRSFQGTTEDYAVGAAAGPGGSIKWPVFKWAGGQEDKCAALLLDLIELALSSLVRQLVRLI